MNINLTHATWLLALPLFNTPAPEELAFAPEEGSEVQITFDQVAELELTSSESTFLINGEEHGGDEDSEVEGSRRFVEHISYTEEFTKVDDDRPLEVRRVYEEIEWSSSESKTNAEGETTEGGQENESGLEGTTVVFKWDEDEEEYQKSFGDDEGDEELLEALTVNGYLVEFLPDGEVAEGEDWEVDVSAFHILVYPGGDLSYHLVDAEEDESAEEEEESDTDDQYQDNLDGEILAEYQGTRDEDGVEVAVILLTVEVSTIVEVEEEINVEINQEEGEGTMVQTSGYDFDLEGELLWDMKAGRAVSLELTGEHNLTFDNVKEMEGAGMSIEMTVREEYEGTIEIRYTFE